MLFRSRNVAIANIRPARSGSRSFNSATYLTTVVPMPMPQTVESIEAVFITIPYSPNSVLPQNLATQKEETTVDPFAIIVPNPLQNAPYTNRFPIGAFQIFLNQVIIRQLLRYQIVFQLPAINSFQIMMRFKKHIYFFLIPDKHDRTFILVK